ncbi:MAG: MipA/OmpV family protein [Kangiellaceae bacterium]|nr:MipA/OmpV family protein [Kangiellaceae bacterium]
MKLTKFKYIALSAVIMINNVYAEDKWGIGLGAMSDKQGYIDVDSKVTVIPVISYESENLRINGPKFEYKLAKYKLANYGGIKMSFIGQYRFDGYDEDDGDIFQGMEDREDAFELGLALNYRSNWGGVSLRVLADASSKHEGYEASVAYAKPYFIEAFVVEPYVGLTHSSEDFVDYYYGVNSDEVLDFRPEYIGKSTTNGKLGVRGNWQASKHHSVIFNLSYTAFGNEIKDSPLIDQSGRGNIILGYIYTF